MRIVWLFDVFVGIGDIFFYYVANSDLKITLGHCWLSKHTLGIQICQACGSPTAGLYPETHHQHLTPLHLG